MLGIQRTSEDKVIEKERRKPLNEFGTKTKAKETFKAKPFETKSFGTAQATTLDYGVGDRVRHMKFGEGTVLEITAGGRDFEVKVDFDDVGVKKMFAGFAKLKKV